MDDALEAARRDLAAGRSWKAMDRLNGILIVRQDEEVLDFMAQTAFDMGDLPRAGGLWYVTGRDDDDARTAIAAWRERHGSPEAQFRSLPRQVRAAYSDKVLELRAQSSETTGQLASWDPDPTGWRDVVGALGVGLVALMALGVWVLGWWQLMVWVWR